MPTINKSQPQRPWMPKRDAFARSAQRANRDIYDSSQWKKLRAIVKEEEPLCRYCLENDLAIDTEVVDHITPINMGGAPYDRANLQGLCRPCHEAKSRQESTNARRGSDSP